MLQQTTVAAVIPYYDRFLRRFPDVGALAKADEADVLRLWEGLGYYSRARNLHRAAQDITTRLGGTFPREVEALRRLPGIGRYTAGAIVSFAFDRPAPVVEANTLRLYSRLLGYRGDPRSAEGQKLLWEFAGRIMTRQRPGELNQALIDLGAIVCTPANPHCTRCPLARCCRALQDGRTAEIPASAARPAVTSVTEAAIAIERRGSYLLRQRGPGERWAGLWDFPRFPIEANGCAFGDGPLSIPLRRQLLHGVADLTGLAVGELVPLMTVQHSVTRYRIALWCFRGTRVSGRLHVDGAPLRWVRRGALPSLPLSVTGRKLANALMREEGPSPAKARRTNRTGDPTEAGPHVGRRNRQPAGQPTNT
jgi:A/G-specific adenine glycosylase